MPRQRVSMRQVHAVLRLKWAVGLSDRQIAQSLGLRRPTVANYVHRAQAAGLSWPWPHGLDATALEQRLFPPSAARDTLSHLAPDWAHVHRERTRTGVPLCLLWQAYKAVTPEGVQYSGFCQAYRDWAATLDVVMRQEHRAGEKLCVEYAGQRLAIVTSPSGEMPQAQGCSAVLGASNSPYAEGPWTQSLPDWIGSHVRTFAAIGGVPEGGVPDNRKSAVNRAQRSAPERNRPSAELAPHSHVAILPARAARPRDKATVDVGGQGVERWMLARRRHHTFCSLPDATTAIAALLPALHAPPGKTCPGSRPQLFDTIDRPARRPLPARPDADAQWQRARVHIDDHVDIEGP